MMNMQKYIVMDVKAIIPEGTILILTDMQAYARKPFLKVAGKDKYRVISSVEFKRNEKFGIVGGIKNKELAGKLEKVKDEEKKDNAPN
jgi:hypothetical protein